VQKQKRVGKVLGASYEGYEQVVVELLMDIEAKHQQRQAGHPGDLRPSNSGRKGCKELKGLVSSINYEARISREAKGKGKAQGGGCCGVSMNLKILSSNVWGLNDREKRLRIRYMLKEWNADVTCFQKTKMELIMAQVVRSLWRCQFVDWLFLGSSGASGGIILMWDKRVMEKFEDAIGYFSVSCKFKNVEDQKLWMFTGVYRPNDAPDRRLMWDELAGIRS
jgi:hypothetical protein